MLHFDFPEDYVLAEYSGVFAFPHGCWGVTLNHKNGYAAGPENIRSLLVWPDNSSLIVNGHFRQSDNYQFISFLGDISGVTKNFLKTKGLAFKKHPDNQTVLVLKSGRKHTRSGQCSNRRVCNYGLSGWNPGVRMGTCIVAPIPRHYPLIEREMNTDLELVIKGILGDNLGIGFHRKGEGGRFIQPDPSKDWILACLSVDELTCLALHKTGGSIIDNPV